MINKQIVLIIFASLFIAGCGTLGSFERVYSNCRKEIVVKEINTFYSDHPEYQIPAKWKSLDDWQEREYDFLDSRIFYFRNAPEEMYYVTFYGDSLTQANSSAISMGIRAVSTGEDKWLISSDFSNNEITRIQERFKHEILSKINCFSN